MKFDVYDVNLDLEYAILPLQNPFLSSSSSSSSSSFLSVCAYCNGLVLLCRYDPFQLTLWNPSTRQFRDLPDCPFQIQKNGDMKLGLGYDASIDDYNVVFIVILNTSFGIEFQVWIFELKSNIWRRIQDFPYPCHRLAFRIAFPKMGYFTDGSLHWVITLDNKRVEIVGFDVTKETFSLVPQPASPIRMSVKLHVLEECLCISYFSLSDGLHQADLYMRNKDGVDRFTWKILFSVKDPMMEQIFAYNFLTLLEYSKRRDKILLRLDTDCMVSFNLEDKSFIKVETENDHDSRWPILCRESLVSVGVGE